MTEPEAPAEQGQPAAAEPSLEATLEEIVRSAEDLLDRPYLGNWKDRLVEESRFNVELIESLKFVTVLVDAPGHDPKDLTAAASEEQLLVAGPGFRIRRTLPCRVVPGRPDSDYRNGILSVRMTKA